MLYTKIEKLSQAHVEPYTQKIIYFKLMDLTVSTLFTILKEFQYVAIKYFYY